MTHEILPFLSDAFQLTLSILLNPYISYIIKLFISVNNSQSNLKLLKVFFFWCPCWPALTNVTSQRESTFRLLGNQAEWGFIFTPNHYPKRRTRALKVGKLCFSLDCTSLISDYKALTFDSNVDHPPTIPVNCCQNETDFTLVIYYISYITPITLYPISSVTLTTICTWYSVICTHLHTTMHGLLNLKAFLTILRLRYTKHVHFNCSSAQTSVTPQVLFCYSIFYRNVPLHIGTHYFCLCI